MMPNKTAPENCVTDKPDDKNLNAENLNEKSLNEKPLCEAAKRALKEAAERRAAQSHQKPQTIKEINGRDGPEPIRYGDWEKNGLISDF